MKKGHQLLKSKVGKLGTFVVAFLGAILSSLAPLLINLDIAKASSNNDLLNIYPSQMTKLNLSLVYTGAEVDETVSTTQSLAITDKYFVVVQASSAKGGDGWIVAADYVNPSSGPVWAVKHAVGHGNGATWDSRRDQIVIVDGVTKHYFDANTGEFIEDFSEGMFATGIAYDAEDDWYIQTSSSNEISGRILDNRFNLLMTFDAGHGLVNQDVAYYDGRIYRIGWGGCSYLEITSKKDAAAYCRQYFGEGSNAIYAFDMNGDFLEAYYIDKGFGELESMAFSKDGTPYLLFNGKPDNVHYSVYKINNFRHNVTGKEIDEITEIQKIDNEALREELLRQIGASNQVDDATVVTDQSENSSDVTNQPSDPSDVASEKEPDEKNGDNSGVNIGEASDTIVVRDSGEADTGEMPDMTIRESDKIDISETSNVTAVEVSDEVNNNEVAEASTENHGVANEDDVAGIATKVITTVMTVPDSEVAAGFENEATTQPEPVVRVAVVAVSNKDEIYGVIDGGEVIDDSSAREVARADEEIKYTELLDNTKEKSNTVDKQNVVAKNENNKVHEDATEPDAVKETTVDENVNTESNLDVPTTGKDVKAEDNKTFDANKVIVITAVAIGCLAIAFCIIVAIRALR